MDRSDQPSRPLASNGTLLFVFGLIGLLGVGAWLRFDGLTDREVWLDESCTFYAVHHLPDWPADGPDRVRELAHTPYVALLHAWTRLFGETAWGLRSFSALIGAASILVIGLVAARFGGRRVGLIAAALAALHPLHIYYSQEARVYALCVLEAAVALCVLHQAARTLRVRWWIVHAVLAWLIVLTHYYALLWLPATAAAIWASCDRRRCLRQWLVTHGVLALSLIPLIWLVVWPYAQGGPKMWLKEIWQESPALLAVPRSLWALLPSGGYPDYLGMLSLSSQAVTGLIGPAAAQIIRWAPAAVVILLLMAAVVATSKQARKPGALDEDSGDACGQVAPRGEITFLFGLSIGFLLIAWLHSWIVGPSYVVGRYDLIAWPSFVIGIALLIDRAANRFKTNSGADSDSVVRSTPLFPPLAMGDERGVPLRDIPECSRKRGAVTWGCVILFCGCGLTTTLAAKSIPRSYVQADRAKRMASRIGENDLVISLGLYRWFMEYEWHRIGFHPRVISFPPMHDRQMCWDNAEAELADPLRIEADVKAVTGVIEASLDAGGHVWLIAHGEPTGPRWEVDKHLFTRLRALNIDVRLRDESIGLAELVKLNP